MLFKRKSFLLIIVYISIQSNCVKSGCYDNPNKERELEELHRTSSNSSTNTHAIIFYN